MRKNSIKNTRVNAEVQRELSTILRGGIKDPRVAPMTSVVAVEVAPDLKTCKAYISVLGDEKAQADTLKGLQSAEGYIRRELAHTLNMRNTPEIKFVLDQSIEYGVRMSKKIDDVTRDLREDFSIYRFVGPKDKPKKLTDKNGREIAEKGKTSLIKGIKKKSGDGTYDAYLTLNRETWSLDMQFPEFKGKKHKG